MAATDTFAKTSDVDGSSAVTDIQKMMKRGEWFGISFNSFKEEKNNSLAKRSMKKGAKGNNIQNEEMKKKS
ncbi:hypothetical protein PHJA_002908400 [Phtheirospermum japonicum]|uniref:Uncharacterized protein n=1 Tax=Phtheirospermum japonicum TaxID=374723 RepID=A0A830DA74_9LAMI|nr:hypothetical protein PHJA_002908400 [Phtheirospermum japonicum]